MKKIIPAIIASTVMAGCSPSIVEQAELIEYQPEQVAELYCEAMKAMNVEQIKQLMNEKQAEKVAKDFAKLPEEKADEFKAQAENWDCTPELSLERKGVLYYSFPNAKSTGRYRIERIPVLKNENGIYLIGG